MRDHEEQAAGTGERHARQGDQLRARRLVPPKLRAKATVKIESELKPLAVASVLPVRAISRVRAEQRPVPRKPRAKSAAEMESEQKPLAAASVTPVRAISCVRAEQQPVLPEPRVKAAAEIVRVGPSEYGSWLSCARACCHSSRYKPPRRPPARAPHPAA